MRAKAARTVRRRQLALCGLLLIASACAPLRPETRIARDSAAAAHCDRARSYWFMGDPDAARLELRRALTLTPDDPDAHRLLGVVYLGRRDLPQARMHLERAVALRPDDLAARTDLGTLLLAEGRFEEAVELFSALIELPTQPGGSVSRAMAHAGLAWALNNLGHHREAALQYKVAIAFDPALCEGYAHLGLTYEALGEYSLAMDAYEEGTRRCGERPTSSDGRGTDGNGGLAAPLFGMLEPTR